MQSTACTMLFDRTKLRNFSIRPLLSPDAIGVLVRPDADGRPPSLTARTASRLSPMDVMLERPHKNGPHRPLLENYQLTNEHCCNRTVNKTTVTRRCRCRFVNNDKGPKAVLPPTPSPAHRSRLGSLGAAWESPLAPHPKQCRRPRPHRRGQADCERP